MLASFENFELDELRFEIRRGGTPVLVQPKVLDLIVHLVRHRDRVVTKDELYDSVWPGVVVTEGSLSQAVSVARKVLGDDSDTPRFIRTVRGRGFQFVAPVSIGAAAPPGAPGASGSGASPSGAPRPGRRPAALDVTSVSLSIDTAPDARTERPSGRPHLFVALHADDLALGGARYDLGDLDEVEVGRGARRDARRLGDAITRRLLLRLPGDAVSRTHARLVRARQVWTAVDAGSKNGTFVNGERIQTRVLEDGDIVECGRTFLLYRADLATPPELRPDVESDERVVADELGSLTPALQALGHIVDRIARSDLPVLVEGETGTGKDVVARAFHARSGRAGPFVTVSGGALEGAHAVRQLFGSVESAAAGGSGVLRSAEGGTLLIDQVETLPAEAQVALVRALDDRAVLPVGATAPVPVDVRIIAATTADLARAAAAGSFRADLLERLAAFRYELPPLRDRRGDLGVLAARALRALEAPPVAVSPQAALALLRHAYAGNIRELVRCLEAAVQRAGRARVETMHLPSGFAAVSTSEAEAPGEGEP